MPDMSKKENQKPPTEGEVPGSAPVVSPEPTPGPAPTPEPTPPGETPLPQPSGSTQTDKITVTLERYDWWDLKVALNENIKFHELIADLQSNEPENQERTQDMVDRRNALFDKIRESTD